MLFFCGENLDEKYREKIIAEVVLTWKAAIFCKNKAFNGLFLKGDALEIVNTFA